ncbi:MAG: O-antigen ligase family protein [Clostridiales bacterium]|nr:O-antigen ligase family protein [Clostridiales bacterium]
MYFTILFNLSYGICAYFFFLSVSDYAKLIDCFSKLSLFLSVFITLQILISGMGGTMSYSQYLGYALLPAAIISINQFLRNRSIIHMINFVYTTILIISMGARWPLVCVILFLIVRSIISPTKLLRKVVLLTALIAIGFVVVYYLDALLDFLETAFRGTGLSMRTLIKIRQANFFEDSGRNDIWSYSVKTISNHLFVGVGIGKDRILIANYKKAPSLVTGYYPHNIILEILLHYGAFFGAIVIILMFLYVAISFKKAIKVARRKQDYAPIDSLVITFALGFFPLLVSGSYLGWVPFFIFLGVCTGIMRNHQLLSEESVLSEKII